MTHFGSRINDPLPLLPSFLPPVRCIVPVFLFLINLEIEMWVEFMAFVWWCLLS